MSNMRSSEARMIEIACWLCDVHQGDYANNRVLQAEMLRRLTEAVAEYRQAVKKERLL